MDFKNKLSLNQHFAEKKEKSETQVKNKARESDAAIQNLGFTGKKNRFGRYFVRYHNEMTTDSDSVYLNNGFRAFGAGLKHYGQWQISIPDMVFMDIETTALKPGAGNVVFLIGIGYYKKKRFHIIQFFLQDYQDEQAMLYALNRFASKFLTLVTFNGHSFDVPMLQSRYDMHRIQAPWLQLPNMDLYHFAKRVYRGRMKRFSLIQMEMHVLGLERSEDIPGQDIPAAFFDYQAHGKTDAMHLVCQHHLQDILSLYFLLNQIAVSAQKQNDSMIVFNLLFITQKQDQTKKSKELAELIANMVQGNMQKIPSLLPKGKLAVQEQGRYIMNLSMAYKKTGHLEWAKMLWLQIALQQKEAALRLTQYYEHIENDIPQAAHWAEYLLEHHQLTVKQKQSIQKRIQRLHQKRNSAPKTN